MENVFFIISEVLNVVLFIYLIVMVGHNRAVINDLREGLQALDGELETTWSAVAHVEDRVDDVVNAVSNVIVDVNALKPAPKPVRKPAAKKPIAKKEVK